MSKWTLRLRTQSGECRIVMIADMPGIGTVWFYPEGVANILSQFSMAAYSKWTIDYSTKRFHETGDYKDLAFFVTTNEGRKCKFTPTSNGLHAMTVKKNTDGYIFGKHLYDNGTKGGKSMCHMIMEKRNVRFDLENGESKSDDNLTIGENEEVNTNVNQITGVHHVKDTMIDSRQATLDENTGVGHTQYENQEYAIDTIKSSRSRFSKRD